MSARPVRWKDRKQAVRRILQGLKEFGYAHVGTDDVRDAMRAYDEDRINPENVIHLWVAKLIEQAARESGWTDA